MKTKIFGCLVLLSLAITNAQTTSQDISGTTTLDAGGFSDLPAGLGSCSPPTFAVVALNTVLVNQSCTCGFVTTQIVNLNGFTGGFLIGSTGPLPGPLSLPQPVAYSGTITSQCQPPPNPPVITTTSLPDATIGLDYEYNVPLTAAGGTPPYHWTVSGLPAGFNQLGDGIDAPTLLLPLVEQNYTVQISVRDAAGATASKTLALTLELASPDLVAALPDLGSAIKVVGAVFDTVRQTNPNFTQTQVAESAFTAILDARNGFFGANNEFAYLGGVDLVTISNADHLTQAYTVAINNGYTGQASAVLFGAIVDPIYNLGKLIINAGYNGNTFFGTGTGPQSPANFDFYALQGAMAAINGTPITAQTVPQQPITTNPPTFLEFGPGPYTLDPPISYGYEYRRYAGAGFQSVQIPQACASQPFPLVYQQADGTQASVVVQSGATYTFPAAVLDFKVTRMVPTATCTPFLTTVGFAGSNYEVLQETPIPIAFADVLADITYAFQNGWINNLAVASTLYLEIQGAQKTTGCPQSLLLKVFTKEVSAESGKHINSQGVALLLNDASLLAGQLPAQNGSCPALK